MSKMTLKAINRNKRNHWKKHIEKWKESGLTQSEYCRRNDLKIKSFGYWKGRILNNEPSEVQFCRLPVPVIQKETSPPEHSLVLRIGKHHEITIGDKFKPETLSRLIHTLRNL